ncbi:hypothetical protein E2C01_059325 [Portunus trituberculatus]|uniref:Uncharacterized protein n=1 Tax=Portunus trituberculatus TaxID=210409 RepID=A0A5B7H8S5_PORTR|nr:hypothetical protein [Portunus trituberculatus]
MCHANGLITHAGPQGISENSLPFPCTSCLTLPSLSRTSHFPVTPLPDLSLLLSRGRDERCQTPLWATQRENNDKRPRIVVPSVH